MFNPNRNELRQMLFDCWYKYQQQLELTPLETQILEVIIAHPEYHKILENPEVYLHKDYFPEQGEVNPFLHLSLHMGIREQINTDRPAGIQAIYKQLVEKFQNTLDAEHCMIDCLVEQIWLAQKYGAMPNDVEYLQELQRLLE